MLNLKKVDTSGLIPIIFSVLSFPNLKETNWLKNNKKLVVSEFFLVDLTDLFLHCSSVYNGKLTVITFFTVAIIILCETHAQYIY